MASSSNEIINNDSLRKGRRLKFGCFFWPSLNDNDDRASVGLRVIARFKSQRQKWLIDGNLELTIDETGLGYAVGKVEMRKSVKSLKEAATLGKELDRESAAFVNRYVLR
jgi:hypothetical protein